jgi:prepilin-type N-terminal cleavage/methylation domain-containing protein/prepilin-type processing-associated H-X9-DG protein
MSVRRQDRTGFTLVESLVVIGIIALLISILFPALRRARLLAQRTQCLSQLRNIGNAFAMYVAENKGRTPVQIYNYVPNWADPAQYDRPPQPNGSHLTGRSMFAALLPYLTKEKRVFVCPVAYEYAWNSAADNPTEMSDTSYMGNEAIVNRRMAQVRRSAQVVLVQENRHRWHIAWLRPARVSALGARPAVYSMWCWNNPTPHAGGKPWGQEYSAIHESGGNLLFADGHAEYRKHTSLRARDFGLTGGAGVGGTADDVNTTVHSQTYLCEFD